MKKLKKLKTMRQLEVVLKGLNTNKARDPDGLSNILLMNKIGGFDLKLALLKMFNDIKNEQVYPDILELSDITPIYKKKGSKSDFKNYRGIFSTSIFRYILDKLIYNDMYNIIDKNLTDSNIGCRKGRNICDNIFSYRSIMHS
jgi:hypothetical protein